MASNVAPRRSAARLSLSDWVNRQTQAAVLNKPVALSVEDVQRAWTKRFTAAEIEDLVIPRRTLARRKSANAKLTQDETDRAVRLARLQTEADRVFGDPETASGWMRAPRPQFSGQSPLQMLKTDAGAKAVSEMLVRIAHGIYA